MPSDGTEHRKLAAIMFTDMVGYSALSQRNEALALELLAEQQRLLRTQFALFNGREVKTTGDGFLVEFPSALEASQCAVEIQRAVVSRNSTQPLERHIQVRIGVHVGDVVHREADMYGDGVNIAARIEPLAKGGGICLSDAVYGQVRNKLGVQMTKLDSPELKHIEVPMDVYRVVLPWQQQPPVAAKLAVPTSPRRGARALTVGLAVVAALGTAAWWWGHQAGKAARQVLESPANTQTAPVVPPAAIASDRTSVAVLPFVNMSADKNDEYLSDGMTEELLNVLAKVKGLRVPGRSSSFAFKGKNEEGIFRKVGEQLHVSTVLEGSVRKAGNQLRITAQLISVVDGFHLWSDNYDRDMTNIFAIQSDIAERVATALKGHLAVEDTRLLAKRGTENEEAYRLYLLGRYHFDKFSETGWTNAIHYYNQALQLDPSFALAYCGLADTYGFMGMTMPGKDAWAKEKELAQKALALDPNLPDAHLSLGMALCMVFDWQGAESKLQRALELNPNLALAHDQVAFLRTVFARFDEAIAIQKKALELDPLSPVFNMDLGFFLSMARRNAQAIEQFLRTLQLDPNNAFARGYLAWGYLSNGETARAITQFQKSQSVDGAPNAFLAYAYSTAGNHAGADQILAELQDLAKRQYVSPASFVTVYLGLGEKDKALDWLEKCYDTQDAACCWLKVHPLYDPIRSEPRFHALLSKIGLAK